MPISEQNTIWKKNFNILKKKAPSLANDLIEYQRKKGLQGRILPSKNGLFVLAMPGDGGKDILIGNIENPWLDVDAHLKTVPPGAESLVVFIGMGLGLGPLLIMRERPEVAQVAILEPSLDVFIHALATFDLSEVIGSEKTALFVGDIDFEAFKVTVERNASLRDIHVLRHVPSFRWNPGLYEPIDKKAYELLSKIGASGTTRRIFARRFTKNVFENLRFFPHSFTAESLKGAFKGMPGIVVSAGPSLDEALDSLKRLKDRAIIFSVDSALPALRSAGIEPHFVFTIDMKEITLEKVSDQLCRENHFALVAITKCSSLVPSRLNARYLMWALQEDLPTSWLSKALGIKTFFPEASSVSHLAAGLAVLSGVDPIVVVGQDLCVPHAEHKASDHAKGVHLAGTPNKDDRDLIYVKSNSGKTVGTTRVFLGIKTVFEYIFKDCPARVINTSQDGIKIEGMEYIPIQRVEKDIIGSLPNRSSEIVKDKLGSLKSIPRDVILRGLKGLEKDMNAISKRLEQSNRHYKRIQEGFKRLPQRKFHALEDLPPKLQGSIIEFDKIATSLDRETERALPIIELTYSDLKKNDDWRRRNEKVRQQRGYIDWLQSEIERIHFVQVQRREAVGVLMDHIKIARSFLEKEAILKGARDKKNVLRLLRLYMDHDMPVLFQKTLEELEGTGLLQGVYQDPEFKVLLGYYLACCEKVEEAMAKWQEAEQHPGTREIVIKYKVKAANHWLRLLKKAREDEENDYILQGISYPHLVKRWVSNAAILSNGLSETWNLLTSIQQDYIRAVEREVVDSVPEKAILLMEAWEMVPEDMMVKEAISLKALYKMGKEDRAMEKLFTMLENYGQESLLNLEPGFLETGARLLFEAQRIEEAVAFIMALQDKGDIPPDLLFLTAKEAISAGEIEAGISILQEYLKHSPEDVQALRLMGETLAKIGFVEEARDVLKRAVQVAQKVNSKAPVKEADQADLNELLQKALELQNKGYHKDAIPLYRKILEAHPDYTTAWQNLGVSLFKTGQFKDAEAALRRAQEISPDDPGPYYNLGVLYMGQGRHGDAKGMFKKTLELDPDHPGALNNLGHIYLEVEEDPEKSLPLLEKLIKNRSRDPKLYYNYATCLWKKGLLDESIEHFKMAIEMAPDFPQAHWNLSQALLLRGKIKEGFKEYLWRWKRPGTRSPSELPVPYWRGEDIGGKVLLVYTEQGAGDNIQFIRYVSALKERCKGIVLACGPDLSPLFSRIEGIDKIVRKDMMERVFEYVDVQVPLLDLPTIFETDIHSIPCQIPYLAPSNECLERFTPLFEPFEKGFKIGFVWRGNPKHANDKNRSCPFEMFSKLFEIPNTFWFSLQFSPAPLPVNRDNLINMAPYIFTFQDTAAILTHLDLLISVDTSVVHLAGALGQKVWTLLPWLPDWRWGMQGDRTPWYPTMRLFRQERPKDWEGVFLKLREEVEAVSQETSPYKE